MGCIDKENPVKSCELSGEWESFIERADLADGFKYTPREAATELGIYTKRKPTEIALKRFLFWYYVKMYNPNLSLRIIGEMTGGQDHATVLNGIRYAKDPYKRKTYLSIYDKEVYKVIIKTDFSNVKKKREGV